MKTQAELQRLQQLNERIEKQLIEVQKSVAAQTSNVVKLEAIPVNAAPAAPPAPAAAAQDNKELAQMRTRVTQLEREQANERREFKVRVCRKFGNIYLFLQRPLTTNLSC
jgi:cell division septum initiation protein DivIVA